MSFFERPLVVTSIASVQFQPFFDKTIEAVLDSWELWNSRHPNARWCDILLSKPIINTSKTVTTDATVLCQGCGIPRSKEKYIHKS